MRGAESIPRSLEAVMDAEKKTWHALSAEEAADALQGDLRRGLALVEVRRRQEQFGLNELKEAPRRGFWRMLLDQFNQFLVITRHNIITY